MPTALMPIEQPLEITKKMPPQNVEAEMCVLGSMLIDPEAVPRALEILRPQYFYYDANRRIFEVMVEAFEKNHPIDLVTLMENLRSKGQLDRVGGASYLTQLSSAVPTSANIEYYARIVKEKSLLRCLISASSQMVEECFEEQGEVASLLDRAEQRIFEISQDKIEGQFVSLRELIHSGIETIDRLYQHKGHVTGLETGYEQLDIKTAGFQPSDLIIVAGRPSMGKSAFVSCVCEHVGVVTKKPVAFFSLEMSKEQVVQRMLCSHARVDAQKVRTGFLSHTDWPLLTKAAGRLSEAPIFIDDTPGSTVLEIRAKARRMKSQHDIQLVVVDYLQLMQAHTRSENRQQEISEISRSLKALAREIKVPVIAISQLSRAVEQRTGNRPQLSDLRESGAIEQDADVVIFLYREEYYKPSEENRNKAEVVIAKQRNGPTGSVELFFFREWTRFENPEMQRQGVPVEEI